MKEHAEKKGGKCLSIRYINAHTKLQWQCSCKYKWEARPANILKGHWCPKCGGSLRLTIKKLQEKALSKGGKLISKEYKNNKDKLEFLCSEGHKFKLLTNNFYNKDHWCPDCNQHFGERICRLVLEEIFNEDFPPSYPIWLKNSRGNQMEFDGYSEKNNLAFEHQGEQHYSDKTHYLFTKQSLEQRKKDDRRKKYLAKKNGVMLIIIPQVGNRLKHDDVVSFIIKKLRAIGFKIPKRKEKIKLNYKAAYQKKGVKKIEEAKKTAEIKKGLLLSEYWMGSEKELLWECEKGHQFAMILRSVKKGGWCSECQPVRNRYTIEDMKNIAHDRNGECISRKYFGAHELLKWKCENGHKWENTPTNIRKGQWCPHCSRKVKKTIEEMQKLAKSRGGLCLSKMYVNNKTDLKWQCKKRGHKFLRTAKKMENAKNFCPICSGKVGTKKKPN